MPKAAKTKPPDLVGRMDLFASRLLDEVSGGEGLSDRISVFERIAKWIEIKHKLAGGGEAEGSMIGELKRQALKGNAARGTARGRAKPAPEPAMEPSAENGADSGDDLAALKSRLPGANHGGSVGHSPDAGGQVHPDGGHDRGLYTGLLSDTEPDADDPDDDG